MSTREIHGPSGPIGHSKDDISRKIAPGMNPLSLGLLLVRFSTVSADVDKVIQYNIK